MEMTLEKYEVLVLKLQNEVKAAELKKTSKYNLGLSLIIITLCLCVTAILIILFVFAAPVILVLGIVMIFVSLLRRKRTRVERAASFLKRLIPNKGTHEKPFEFGTTLSKEKKKELNFKDN